MGKRVEGEEHYLHCCGGSPSAVTDPQYNPGAASCKKSTAHCYRRSIDGGELCLELPFCLLAIGELCEKHKCCGTKFR